MRTIAVGDKVKLTGKFLRSTGQIAGPEGSSTWTVLSIDGEKARAYDDRMVTTDQTSPCYSCQGVGRYEYDSTRGKGHVVCDPCDECAGRKRTNRRIAAANLHVVSTVDARNA